jgi:hypothetical protein
MAGTQVQSQRGGVVDRLFFEHPRSLGMGWARHGAGAVLISARLVGAGLACLVHAAVPGLFTQTAGKTVTRMYEHMLKRRAGAANPENWPDYEI